MEQQTYSNSDISTLEQAELAIRRKGIVHDEKVEGRQLLELCGFSKIDNTSIKRQIEKHAFIEGIDFMPSMAESSGGRPKTVIHFSINAANHVMLGAMTPEGKEARQKAINREMDSQSKYPDLITTMDERLSSTYSIPAITPHQQLEMNMDASLKAMTFVKAYGIKGNQAMLAADRLVKSQINFSPLEAMGQTALSAPVQKMTFTPTQLGQLRTPPSNSREMNKLLEAAGLQIKIDNHWIPTDQGLPLCEILDTGKTHNTGTPVKQVKWYQSVLDHLNQSSPAPLPIKYLTAHETSHTEPVEVGSNSDDEPVRRNQKRKRNRYELDDYFSLVELGEFIGRSRQYVVEVLEKHRIIKWTGLGKRGKYLLTNQGWKYGLMYDPCEVTFHNHNSKRLTSSNAQPVLGYDILKFFN